MARILIVESNATVRELLDRQLRHLGHEPVSDPREASDAALVEPADPAALDLAARLVRERPGHPLLFISTREPSAETRALQPAAHLVKPVRMTVLGEAITRALARAP